MITLRSVVVLLALGLLARPAFSVEHYANVAGGDVNALKSVLLEAQARPGDTWIVIVGGTYRLGPNDQLPEIRATVSIHGWQAPAYFLAENGGPENLFQVGEQGTLILRHVSFDHFDLSLGGEAPDAGVIVNRGELQIHTTQFRDNRADINCFAAGCEPIKPLVLNLPSGVLSAERLSIVDSGVYAPAGFDHQVAGSVLSNHGEARLFVSQMYLTEPGYAPAIANSGDLRLRNVTLMAPQIGGEPHREWIVSDGIYRLSNSIIDGFGAQWCSSVKSLGYNLISNPGCGLVSRQDIVGEPSGLRWREVASRWRGSGEPEMLTHALVPILASAAVDSANEDWCPSYSIEEVAEYTNGSRARDGNRDGVSGCDRGAVEVLSSFVAEGGINGLYYDPTADGHYVYVADTAFNTMVMWTTFDVHGDPAWIFGIADKAVAGKSLVAQAYINRGGRVSGAGQFDPATAERWGFLELDISDCQSGSFAFTSQVPGFGTGQFEIRRLASLKRLDCEEGVQPDPVQHIYNGNVNSLIAAMTAANQRPPGEAVVLELNGNYVLDSGQELPPVSGNLTIRGGQSGGRLTANGLRFGTLFSVVGNGSLKLVDLEISDFSLDGPLILNNANLELERVQFSRNHAVRFCFRFGCRYGGQQIENVEGATLRMDRVSMVNSGTSASTTFPFAGSLIINAGEAQISNFQFYSTALIYYRLIANSGAMHFKNSTLYMRLGGDMHTLFSDQPGQVSFQNSIIAGFDAGWCDDVESLGYNLIENPQCSFTAEGDVVGHDPELLFIPVESDWTGSGQKILTHALVPRVGSIAVDSGSASACANGSLVTEARNALDGNGDGFIGCDRGAVERIPSTLTQGGVNGLYFNSEADGHYLYVAETEFTVLVMWTTFDANGDQAWIFGIADRVRSNGRVLAHAYINRNGKVRLDGNVFPAESEPWGTLDLRMNSCGRGKLVYQSDQPGFGSGEFQFERLAEVDQVGCVD